MAFPTTGYSPATVEYFIGSNADVQLTITGVTVNAPAAVEELLGYLEDALADFKTAYEGGTSNTVTMNKHFAGQTTPTSL